MHKSVNACYVVIFAVNFLRCMIWIVMLPKIEHKSIPFIHNEGQTFFSIYPTWILDKILEQ